MSPPRCICALLSRSAEVDAWVSHAVEHFGHGIELHTLKRLDKLVAYLETVAIDCVIVESAEDGDDPLQLLETLRALPHRATPLPCLSLVQGELGDFVARALQAGALDALNTSKWAQQALPFMVYRAVEMGGLSSRVRRQEREFREYLDGASDGVCAFQTGRVVYHNQSFAALLSQARIEGPIGSLHDLFGAPRADALLRTMRQNATIDPFDLHLHPTPDPGAEIIVQVRLRQVDFEGRRVWLATFTDVSKERRNEATWLDLQTAYHELQQSQIELLSTHRLQALGEISAGVAHDFNNVLTTIIGRAALLKRQISDRDALKSVAIIEQAADDGTETVRRIQSFSHAAPSQPASGPVDLNQVLTDAIDFMSTRLQETGVDGREKYAVQLELSDVAPISGSAAELREVALNLMGNALDAMPGGGTLRVGTQSAAGAVIAFVADTGQGMPPEVLARACEPFFTTKGNHGSGLGLSVSYAILRRHRGALEIKSELGVGTRVEMRFSKA